MVREVNSTEVRLLLLLLLSYSFVTVRLLLLLLSYAFDCKTPVGVILWLWALSGLTPQFYNLITIIFLVYHFINKIKKHMFAHFMLSSLIIFIIYLIMPVINFALVLEMRYCDMLINM